MCYNLASVSVCVMCFWFVYLFPVVCLLGVFGWGLLAAPCGFA